MKIRRLLGLPTALALVALAFNAGGAPVRAGTSLSYPADCPTSIQQCIDALPGNGDTVYVFADDAAGFSITKSVSVKSGNATQYRVHYVQIADPASSPPIFATVAGLNVDFFVQVYLNSSVGSEIIVRNMVVNGQPGQASTVSLDAETSASFTLENSVIHGQNNANVVGLLAVPNGGNINVRLVGNRIDAHGMTASGPGILLNMLSSGNAKVDIYNNVIWDVAREQAGAASGIAILPTGTVRADVNVVGNTVELSAVDGLQQRNSLTAGGQLALDLFNNTFSHSAAFGLRLTKGLAGTLAFRAGFNNFFANALGNQLDGLSLGAKNKAVDPKFVDRTNGNLMLTAGSGLLNKGKVCSPGGVANPDAANHHRVAGPNVDIGAYELGAGGVDGVVLLGGANSDSQTGSDGTDILCGYAGNDTQSGAGGNDFMDGGPGGDLLIGGLGTDRMLGAGSADTLCANDGAPGDFLNGGGGTDKFKADVGDTRKSVERAGTCP